MGSLGVARHLGQTSSMGASAQRPASKRLLRPRARCTSTSPFRRCEPSRIPSPFAAVEGMEQGCAGVAEDCMEIAEAVEDKEEIRAGEEVGGGFMEAEKEKEQADMEDERVERTV